MDHREAERHLIDFVDGRLDQRTRDGMCAHVESCTDCRSWLETHNLLACKSEPGQGVEHPDGELLALCAIRPEEINEPGRSEIGRHLEVCTYCREEMELVRDAVRQARPRGKSTASPMRATPVAPWLGVAAAACIVGVAVWLLLPSGTARFDLLGSEPYDIAAPVEDSPEPMSTFQGEELDEMEFDGIHLIEAEGRLTLGRVKIRDGAQVTIHAGNGVAFGDGFQIGSHTRVAVGSSPTDPETDPVAQREQG